MGTLGQNKVNQNFFRGISSFWSRFFKDREVLESLSAANDHLMGQLYLELLELLLANSIKDVPVFSKSNWKLLTFNSKKVEIEDGKFKFKLNEKIRALPFLYNKIFDANTILENNKDYEIVGEYIYFYNNIFNDLEFPGFATRREQGATIISLWAPEASIDKEYVYEQYGRMLDIYEPSSESYKAFIQGIWFYYMNGPTINRITSAMNIIGGYPLASEDGEIVLSIRSIDGTNYIKTTVTNYEIPSDVGLVVEVGDTLSAFQFLTDAYTVTDYIDDPNWFDHIIVPIEVIPGLDTFNRTTNARSPHPIFIGYPIVIGTPGWIIGAGGLPNFMWLFFNGVLKYNIFYVTYNALASRFVRSNEDLQDIVLSGKPAFDLAMVVPYVPIEDTVEEMSEDGIYIDGEFDLETVFDTPNDAVEDLAFDIDFEVFDETYGKYIVAFGSTPTIIGSGVIGEPGVRLASNVPERIGTNTIGLTESGLYTEFPLEIFVQ